MTLSTNIIFSIASFLSYFHPYNEDNLRLNVSIKTTEIYKEDKILIHIQEILKYNLNYKVRDSK